MNIVFLDVSTVGDVPNLGLLHELGNVTFHQTTTKEQTAVRIEKAEVVITNKVVLGRELLEGAYKLKLICVAATGVNNIDLDGAAELGITVKNVAGYASKSVAQSTFAMILQLMQNVRFYDDYVKSGEYSKSEIFTNMDQAFHELSGKRFGIIGLGNIGRRVARIAEAFGSEVVYYSTSGENSGQPYKQLNLEELLSTSDLVSIHAPLNEKTENLVRYERLKEMKPSSILVNTGRGGIVNETDLARAIDEKLIAGAAMDVFETEPIKKDNPLLKVKYPEKLILTPHMTWSSVEARTALIEGVRENIEQFIRS